MSHDLSGPAEAPSFPQRVHVQPFYTQTLSMHTCTAAVLVARGLCAFSASHLALRTPPSFDAEGRWRHLAAVAAEAPQSPSELREILPCTGGDGKTPCRCSSVESVRWRHTETCCQPGPPPTPPQNITKKTAQVKRSHVGLTVRPFVLQICVCLLQLFPDLWRRSPGATSNCLSGEGKVGGNIRKCPFISGCRPCA